MAIVVVKRELKPGVLQPGMVHAEPGLEEKLVGAVQSGTTVEVIDTATVEEKNGPKKWYRIRWVDGGRSHEGWMHSDILKSAVEGVSLP